MASRAILDNVGETNLLPASGIECQFIGVPACRAVLSNFQLSLFPYDVFTYSVEPLPKII